MIKIKNPRLVSQFRTRMSRKWLIDYSPRITFNPKIKIVVANLEMRRVKGRMRLIYD
jgi:hypothetical protein